MKQSSSSDDESSNSLCRSDFLAAMKVKSGAACGCLSGGLYWSSKIKEQEETPIKTSLQTKSFSDFELETTKSRIDFRGRK
jgi:hypothetical protein